jgi:hypothetical protein
VAKQTINSNSVEPLGGPNTGLSVELGDSWNTFATKMNAMMNDLYGSGTQSTAGAFPIVTGTTSANISGQGIISLTTVGDYALASPVGQGIFAEIIFNSTQGSTSSGSSIILSSSATLDGVNFVSRATSSSGGTSVKKTLSIVSLSTAAWQILSNNGLTGTLGLATV